MNNEKKKKKQLFSIERFQQIFPRKNKQKKKIVRKEIINFKEIIEKL